MPAYGPIRQRRWRVALLGAAAACLLSGCVTLSLDVPRPVSTSWQGPAAPELVSLWSDSLAGDGPGSGSGYRLVADSLDAFALRAILARRARHTLDLQYYIIHADDTGQLLAAEVLRAADRGVRVRILLDDIYAIENDRVLIALDSHPNIEIRLFNPWRRRSGLAGRVFDFIASGGRLNQRMHNKLYVADGEAALLGGRNLGDEYFAVHPDLDFRDLDVLAVGAVAREAGLSFDAFWNSEYAVPASAIRLARPPPTLPALQQALGEHERRMRDSPFAGAIAGSPAAREVTAGRLRLERAPGQIVADDPEKLRPRRRTSRPGVVEQLRAIMGEPTERLLISSPYFVPGRDGVALLRSLRERGVAIEVLTNSFAATDVRLVHVGYAKYRPALLRAGVVLRELRRRTPEAVERVRRQRFGSANASLHAKALAIDGRWLFVGSLNIDPRSIVLNTEIGVVMDSPTLTAEAERMFAYTSSPEISYEVRLVPGTRASLEWRSTVEGVERVQRVEPGTNVLERVALRLLQLLPFIEKQI
jgi:putative cardiolipin synthase